MLRNVALWLRPAGWPLLPAAARPRTLALAWTAILAQAVLLGGWVLAGALEPQSSAIRQYISELGREGAANPWIFMAFMAIWGLGWIAVAVAVMPSLRTRPWPLAMPVFFRARRRVRDPRRAVAYGLLGDPERGLQVTRSHERKVVALRRLEERLWALIAQLWALICATVLILEATLQPRQLQAHEASLQRQALEHSTVNIDLA